MPSAAAGASDADAAYRHAMIDVYMSITEGVKRRGHPSCVWRLLEFGCGTIIAGAMLPSMAAGLKRKRGVVTLTLALPRSSSRQSFP